VVAATTASSEQGSKSAEDSGETDDCYTIDCYTTKEVCETKRSQDPIHNILPAPPDAELPVPGAYVTTAPNRKGAKLSALYANDNRLPWLAGNEL
jgi:hypothetical protein